MMIVAGAAPFGEVIGGGALDGGRDGFAAAQHRGIACLDGQVGAAADKTGAALENDNPRRLIRAAGCDVVDTGLEQPDAAAQDIDLGALVVAELAQMHVDPPLRHADLHQAVAKIGDLELGIVRDVDRVGADADFGARLRVGRKPPAGSDRKVDVGRRPVGFPWAIVGEGTVDEAHTADSGGWILLSEGGGVGEKSESEDGFAEEAHGPIP